MKTSFFKLFSLASVALFNIKKSFAYDEFLANTTRPEFFELIDFKIPTITVNLSNEDYENFILGYDCIRDCSPTFLRRNEACYTASWVDLNEALRIAIEKKYINIDSIKKNSNDYQLVKNVINNKNHKLSLYEFENLVVSHSDLSLEKIMAMNYGLYKFKQKKLDATASMTFELDGKVETVKKIKIKVGGRSTRNYSKLGYNISIKGGQDFHGVKNLRLRSEVVDPTFIRDKLGYDLYSLINLPTLSANYAKLYFNQKYMGLFLVRDAFKSHWIEQNYGEKNTTHLYSCDSEYGNNVFFNCHNDAKEDNDKSEDPDWTKFLNKLEKVKTREELAEFFDVDSYIKWQVSRYAFGSWDHVTRQHNNVVYMYHDTTNGRDFWIPFLYDFDLNFGARNIVNATKSFNEEVVKNEKVNPLYKILNINENSEEVLRILQEIFETAFNPNKILARIDELRDFLAPYVLEDRTPDKAGRLPGRVDRVITNAEDNFTFEHFLKNIEFSTIESKVYDVDGNYMYNYFTYGALKGWIIERFRFACQRYNLDCSFSGDFRESPYANNYKAETIYAEVHRSGCNNTGYSCCMFDTTSVILRDNDGQWGIENDQWCLFENKSNTSEYGDMDPNNCWSESQGYSCCKNATTTVRTTDSKGYLWGIENNEWCGITGAQCKNYSNEYPCCKRCKVHTQDQSGYWGVEDGHWCSIPYTCRTDIQD